MTIWTLNKGDDRRIRGGHPWVFSNELLTSPKGLPAGSPVELRDAKGDFLAWGYGNPNSLIAFRALSTSPQERDAASAIGLVRRLVSAWEARASWGFQGSFRLAFGEGDFIPGIVVDRYLLPGNKQVLAFQTLTAGMQFILNSSGVKVWEDLISQINAKGLSEITWQNTSIVQRNDVNIRKLEGMLVEDSKILSGPLDAETLTRSKVLMQTPMSKEFLELTCDLFQGQKTGFFLDQRRNIFDFIRFLSGQTLPKTIRILDLCCYVGHWSTQLTYFLKNAGVENIIVDLVDISKEALSFAQENAERYGAKVNLHELNVVHDLGRLPENTFDIVISDPPAFIKAKKDIPTGTHAYLKMNAEAFKLAKYRGYVVSCSCSGLLDDLSFKDVLRKAQLRSTKGNLRAVLSGGHASDHPVRLGFPEGYYLKMWTHQI